MTCVIERVLAGLIRLLLGWLYSCIALPYPYLVLHFLRIGLLVARCIASRSIHGLAKDLTLCSL